MSRCNRIRAGLRALLKGQNGLAIAILIACLVIGLKLQRGFLTPASFQTAIAQLGWWGPLIYIGVLIVSVVISPIPSAPLAMVAGAIWGPIWAGIYSVIGGFLGGLMAYWLGYSLGRSAIQAMTGKTIYFSKRRGEVFLGWLIFVSRLLPIFSFDLISYSAGITGLAFPIYATATLLGMIPSTFLLTYMGAAFTVSLPLGILVSVLFIGLMIGLPWAIQRHNWFGLRDIIRIE